MVKALNEKDDRLMLALLEDRLMQCSDRYMITWGNFLDMRQRSIAEKMLQFRKDAKYGFYGGFGEAERVVPVFLPEYIEQQPGEYFASEPDDDPLTVLRASLKKGAPQLSHRDYLGALMGLGIKREVTGDILVRDDGADIIVMKDMADFILTHMEKAGRARIEFEEVPVSGLIVPEAHVKEITASVASLRLDNIVSSVFDISRSKAAEAIEAGIVFINGISVQKSEKHACEGDKIVLRGKGKAVFRSIEGTSSKGRTIIKLDRYV